MTGVTTRHYLKHMREIRRRLTEEAGLLRGLTRTMDVGGRVSKDLLGGVGCL